MTDFTERIIILISQIPYGKVSTYGSIALFAGDPRGARQVSRALHSMSRKHKLPWHRVINSQGKISLPVGGGRENQIFLLRQEGVYVEESGKICLEKYMWKGPE